MRKKRLLILIGTVCLSLMLVIPFMAACAKPAPAPAPAPTPAPAPAPAPAPTPAPAPPEGQYTWIFATASGAGVNVWGFHPYPRWQTMIEEATGGRLTIDTKLDLIAPTEVIDGVIGGRADVGFQRSPWVAGTFPLWDFGSLPFIWANNYEYEKALKDPRMIEIMEKTYADVDLVKLMEPADAGVTGLFANKAIPTLDDFKGMKIRTTGLAMTYAVELMGASPLAMDIYEISDALARGTVDGVCVGLSFGLGFGMVDVTKYYSFWELAPVFGGMLVVNMDTWNELPADLQAIVKEESLGFQDQIFFGFDALCKMSRIGAEAAGVQITVPEAAEVRKAMEVAKPAIDKWLEVAGPYGPEVLAIAADYAGGAEIMLK